MNTAFNTLNSGNSLSLQAVGNGTVTSAIKTASAQTGVDFSYLMKKADVESSLNPTAKASTSSATGLYQFVEQTWLRVVKAYGEKYGLGEVADRIAIGNDGVARVNDNSTRQAILNLRKDPQVSSQMAAELTNANRETLQERVGGKIGSTELYLAHFLGAGGATTFLKQMHANPQTKAADVMPTAAAANQSVFYDKEGNARSLGQIYQHFAKKFDGIDATNPQSAIQVASVANKNNASAPNLSHLLSGLGLGASQVASSDRSPSMMTQGMASSNSYVNAMVMAQMSLGDAGTASSSLDMLYSNSNNASARKKDPTSAYKALVA